MKKDDYSWVKRNIIDEPRLSDLVETYKSLGFDIKLKDFNPREFPEECTGCLAAFPEKYKVIYTRIKKD